MSTPKRPSVIEHAAGSWRQVFYDNFTDPATLTKNYFHPFGDSGWRENPANKWKWDAYSNKEIHWDFTASYIVKDAEGCRLRTCVYSDWFHRIDRLATRQKFGYGYFEATVRFKGAEGMHAAFWLLPDSIDESRIYPPGLIPGGIEVDVVEHRLKDGSGKWIDWMGNTATHWDGYGQNHQSAAYSELNLPQGSGNWCTYGVLHDESGIKWFWNGRLVNQTIVNSPTPGHIYFSTEVNESGGWAGNDMSSYGSRENPAGYIEVREVVYWSPLNSVPTISAPAVEKPLFGSGNLDVSFTVSAFVGEKPLTGTSTSTAGCVHNDLSGDIANLATSFAVGIKHYGKQAFGYVTRWTACSTKEHQSPLYPCVAEGATV